MRKLIIAALASVACLGAVAAPAMAGQQYAQTGAFREATNLCLAWFPNTCHDVQLVSWSGPYWDLQSQYFYRFQMRFRGYVGSRQQHCNRYLHEYSSGAYAGDYQNVECFWDN